MRKKTTKNKKHFINISFGFVTVSKIQYNSCKEKE